ncbi:MAG TPA: hypothetical protein VMG40_01060 [Bryobacteraceae bacterium]|nr:hypothetical protein [Bryobacteraceae bacterium]
MDVLSKYRPFNLAHSAECERTLEMLREGIVWMAAPSSFNDPFDCQPSILRNMETERRDRATIVTNYLGAIKRALRTGAQMADKRLQPIDRRDLVELRRLLESRLPDDRKYQALRKRFAVPLLTETQLFVSYRHG